MQHQDGAMDGLSGCWGISIWCALESPCDDGLYALSQDTDGAMFRILCNLLPRNDMDIFSSQASNLHITLLKFSKWEVLYGKLVTWMQATRSLSIAHVCWMLMPDAIGGLHWQVWICMSVTLRLSVSHAQEPGCHLLLLPKQWLVNRRSGEWS
jgi:hypothetical protein